MTGPELNSKAVLPAIECERCVAPGACCKALPLTHYYPLGTSIDEIKIWLASENLPFVPIRRRSVWRGQAFRSVNGESMWLEDWLYSCPKLGEDGRCTIYEDRPPTCRVYEPGCDNMCVHMRGMDGNPIVPLLPTIPTLAA